MQSKIVAWLNARYPIGDSWRQYFSEYYVPKNLNFWYCFGILALLVLAIQFISGIWLTFFYTPTTKHAFSSIEIMMREVNFGWLFRYIHTTGASAFFIVIYLHIMRSILYGSYKKPRELIWITGFTFYLLLMVEAFCGYILPWGQMSYWAAQVLTSTLSAIPFVGEPLMHWIRGDYSVSNTTLHRCFAMHVVVLPLLFIVMVKMHLTALRHIGGNNPTGKDTIEKIPFHPHYTVKDLLAVIVFLFIFAGILFFMPDMAGYFLEPNNFIPADSLQTPEHITTPWYIAPFYAVLRAIPDKLWGIIAACSALLLWFFLPWLDDHPLKPLRQRRPITQLNFCVIITSFCSLGYLGLSELTPFKLLWAQIFTTSYFGGFILLTLYSRCEKSLD